MQTENCSPSSSKSMHVDAKLSSQSPLKKTGDSESTEPVKEGRGVGGVKFVGNPASPIPSM
jgi:hypothetical protein